MKKICIPMVMLFLFSAIPIVSMDHDPIEDLYQKLGTMNLREMSIELKTKNDEILFKLLAHRGGNIPIAIANATSWELLDRLSQEDLLQRFFETGKIFPSMSKQQETILKSNFFRFLGLYIAHPAPNEKQAGALKLLQEMPDSSIADFVFVSDGRFTGTVGFFQKQKLLILKNDYKTIGLFRPYPEPPKMFNALALPGPVIKLYVRKEEGQFIPSCVTAQNIHAFSRSKLSILGNKVAVVEELAPIPEDAHSLRFAILLLFHDLSVQKMPQNTLSLENLLFLTYLYRFQHFASDTMPLDRSLMEYYNTLPKEIRDRLNIKFEARGKQEAAKKTVKKTVRFQEEQGSGE
jgi:hypothetical protein